MAVKFTKTTTEKVDIKGILNEDATEITYEEGKDKIEKTVSIMDYMKLFASKPVQFTIQTKKEEELDTEIEEIDADDLDAEIDEF